MNNPAQAALLASLLSLSLTAQGQVVDSTFTSYDWIRPSVVSAKTSLLREYGDTSIFNPSAVMLHDGASLDALLLEIPGLVIDARGNVTVSGRPVRELLVEGHRYFGTDVSAGLRNIPAGMVGAVRAYEKDSDVGLVSGVDLADKAMVLDITIKQKERNRFNHSLKAALGWQDRYDGKYNGNRVSRRGIVSAVAGSENTGALQKSSGTSLRTGLGDNSGKRQSEAGITVSFPSGRAETNASILYRSTGKSVLFEGHDDYFRTSGTHSTENGGRNNERDHNLNAQATVEWKGPGPWRIMLKPQMTLTRKAAADSLYGESFRGDSLSPYYRSLRRSDGGGLSLTAGSSLLLSKRMSRRGRTLSLNVDGWYHVDNQLVRASTDGHFSIRNRSVSSWKDRESRLNTNGVEAHAQLLFNEPVSRRFSAQLSCRQAWRTDWFLRDNTVFDGGTPQKDPLQCADGRHDFLSADLSATGRWTLEHMTLTAGLSLIPVYSGFHSIQNGEQTDTTCLRLNVCPKIAWNWHISEQNSLKITYKGFVKNPSAGQMLPLAANTNPVYIQQPNPGLRPSFTQEMALTWKVSDRTGSRGFSAGGRFQYVEDAISSLVENNPESSGRIVTPVNVDGNLSAGADLSAHLAAGDFLFTGHLQSDYSRKFVYLFDDVEKIPRPGAVRTGFIKPTLVATFRIPRLEVNALLEGELTGNRLDLRPDMDMHPRVFTAGTSATWQPGKGWTLSGDMRYSLHRGYIFESLNRNYLIMNTKISKSVLRGKLVFQLDARDILRRWQNEVFTMTSERRGFKIYQGNASYILARLMVIL
jgi:hypothetical protein